MAEYKSKHTGAAIDAAVDAVANKQDKITGAQGQVVGFDAEGRPVAQQAPSGGVTSWNDLTDKPFGEETVTGDVVQASATIDGGQAMLTVEYAYPIVAGGAYQVNWMGTVYETEGFTGGFGDGLELICVGNPSFFGGEDNGLPFLIGAVPDNLAGAVGGNMVVFALDGSVNVYFTISGTFSVITQIPREFIPDMGISNIGDGSTMGAVKTSMATPEGDDYAMGIGAFAEGLSTKAIGEAAHAEGEETTASGTGAHAEGVGTIASEWGSHAEGNETTASGYSSHAEGDGTTASGDSSHAEGSSTTASSSCAHAEGSSSTASGFDAHAEGRGTTASATSSHAEGWNTIAASRAQHVQGRYNVEDKADKYAHIVGNGEGPNRSNAHTIDWNGVGWFQGGVKVGGMEQDDAAADYLVTRSELEAVAGASELIPDYWNSALALGMLKVQLAMEAAGRNKSAFFWYHDVHWTNNSRVSPKLLKFLSDYTPINKTFFGGDVMDAEGEGAFNRDAVEYVWNWRAAVRNIPNHHSVVGNHDDGNSELYDGNVPANFTYAWLMAAEETNDIVRGGDFYYYIDDPNEKTRYLFLDTATKNFNYANNADQQDFVHNALKTAPNGWSIVAIAHIWYDVDYTATPPVSTSLSQSAQLLVNTFDAYNRREGAYAACKAQVKLCIGGHTHVDETHFTASGIPIILTETDSRNVRSNNPSTDGTTDEASVNAVVVDYTQNKISVVRIGRGEGREVSFTIATPVSYTNLLTLATDAEGNIYNGTGYKEDTSYENNGMTEVTATGWDLTGFIPVRIGDVVRFKNVEFMDMDGSNGDYSKARMCFYDIDHAYVTETSGYKPDKLMSDAWSPVYDDSGNVIQFTVPTVYNESIRYMRISADDFNENSVITVNEEIV